MKLVFPTLDLKEKAIAFINEFYEYGSEINGCGGLDRFLENDTYEQWLDKLHRDMDIANVPDHRVPALTYFYVRQSDEQIVGMINLRLKPTFPAEMEVGHIGYCIRPTQRRKGYGSQMLRDALRVYDTLNISRLIITCARDNPASAGVIRNCGGILDAEFYSEAFREDTQRYIIRRNIP